MERMTREEWLAKGKRLFGPDWKTWELVCPVCKTPQTAKQLMETSGYGDEKVQAILGFSCVGRFNGAGEFNKDRKEKKFGCNWTLGGLLRLHTLELTYKDDDGKEQVREMFEFHDVGVCGKPCSTRQEYEEGHCTSKQGHKGICRDENAF